MWEDQGTVYVRKDVLKTCWPWHAEEWNMAKQFRESLLADLVHTVHTVFFVFFGCCCSSGKYCKQIQYLWLFLDNQIKYSWNSIISLLKYCTLNKNHFALQYWQRCFFVTTLPGTLVYFSDINILKTLKTHSWEFLIWVDRIFFLVNSRLNICILFLWFNNFYVVEGFIRSVLSVCLSFFLFVCLSACLSIHQFSIFIRNSALAFFDFWNDGK